MSKGSERESIQFEDFVEWCNSHDEAVETDVEWDNGWVCRVRPPFAEGLESEDTEKFKYRDEVFRGSIARTDRKRLKIRAPDKSKVDVQFADGGLYVGTGEIDFKIEKKF